MNNFMEQLQETLNSKQTENGAYAYKSTLDAVLDAFALLGAYRSRNAEDKIDLFAHAYDQDAVLALRLLFYVRDVRGGLGERDTFRTIAKWLARNHYDAMTRNMKYIPEFGRWDDLYTFVDTPLEATAMSLLVEQLKHDVINYQAGKPISLAAKWCKSINATSKETRKLGLLTARYAGLTEKQYRKTLSMLRKYSNVVEVKMSDNNWMAIDYPTVPGYAMKNYSNAFYRHDSERFGEYKEHLLDHPEDIKAQTLYPYDLVREYLNRSRSSVNDITEAQWKALPNYVTDGRDFLIMADTSGSMYGTPMEVATGLAIYFAQRNTGAYHNKFLTFSGHPEFISLHDGMTLKAAVQKVEESDWGCNTDLEAAFNSILNTAIKNHLTTNDLPKALVVITDMEIDYCGCDVSFTTEMRKRFADAGLEMPTIVWWNVDARNNTFHADHKDIDVRFVSGCSASIFKGLIENMGDSPLDLMLRTLNSERYSMIN